MLIAATALTIVTVVFAAVLVVRERARAAQWALDTIQAAHERETAAVRASLEAVVAAQERERKQWFDERQTLLNRIKPETAQPVIGAEVITPRAVDLDDDEDFFAAQNGLTKEQFAELAFAQETHEPA